MTCACVRVVGSWLGLAVIWQVMAKLIAKSVCVCVCVGQVMAKLIAKHSAKRP